jgi:single-strand DNA-binding protein
MFNKIILHGRLVRDPERTVTPNGVTICKFTIANNRKTKVRDEVLFIDCTAFNKTAEVCSQYLAKGSVCIISGKLVTEKWTGKDGQEKQKNAITVEEVEFISRSDNQNAPQPQYPKQYQQQQYQAQQAQYQQPPAYQQPAQANPAIQEAITQAINDQQEPLEDNIPF